MPNQETVYSSDFIKTRLAALFGSIQQKADGTLEIFSLSERIECLKPTEEEPIRLKLHYVGVTIIDRRRVSVRQYLEYKKIKKPTRQDNGDLIMDLSRFAKIEIKRDERGFFQIYLDDLTSKFEEGTVPDPLFSVYSLKTFVRANRNRAHWSVLRTDTQSGIFFILSITDDSHQIELPTENLFWIGNKGLGTKEYKEWISQKAFKPNSPAVQSQNGQKDAPMTVAKVPDAKEKPTEKKFLGLKIPETFFRGAGKIVKTTNGR